MPPPNNSPKPAAAPTGKTPKDRVLLNLKHQERKALEKLDRIKKWPKEHQEVATERAQEKLNNIRQEMKKLAS